MNYKLSPSDFTFLYEGCKKCFYQKIVNGILQPSIPLPSIFSKIATLLKNYYHGKHTKEIHPNIPPGIVEYGEKYVKSNPIMLPNHKATCFISGRFDIAVRFEDGTYGIIDFKTADPKDEHVKLYKRQLYAYAYALENPAPGALALSPITKIGLLYFPPSKISWLDIKKIAYESDIHWIEINKNEQDFLKFIEEVLSLLESSEPPTSSSDCQWCKYLDHHLNNV